MKKQLLVLALTAVLAACGSRESTPGSEAAPAADAPAGAAPSTAAPSSTELSQAATATQESAGAEDSSPGDASLERMAAMPEAAQLPGGKWKAGTHYTPIVPAQGTTAEPGQVEVLEILWLGCPHCYELQPYIESWKAKKPAYVKFSQEHVMWGDAHRAQGRLFYTLETLGRPDLITKAFEQIHRHRNMLVANSDSQTQQMQLAFAKANGLKEADFKRESAGFAVNTRLQRAEELMRRYKVDTVPLFVVNGKYRTDVGMAGGPEQLLQLLNDLAAAEKSR